MTDRRRPPSDGARPSRPSGSPPRTRHDARRLYLSLGAGELTSVATFAMLGVWFVPTILVTGKDLTAFWLALAPLLFVLLQGGAYWLLARNWVGASRMPVGLARVFGALKWLNLAVLGGALVGIVLWWPSSWPIAALIVLTWVFGVVEYINYFVVRLSYPARVWPAGARRLQAPRLIRDLRQVGRR